MVITEVTPAVAILTGSQHESPIKRVLHKVRVHLKGNRERDNAQWGVGNRWTVRTSESCYGFSLLTLFNICFLEIWGALSYWFDMFIRTQDSQNQLEY